MRHNNTNNNLGRKSAHRKAMLSNMASSLILHKRIKTTSAKAKALRVFVEPILTKSKEDSTNARRYAFNYLQNKNAVSELFREISPKITDRPGGYTRILKIGTRPGDAADMCYIELVDFNEAMIAAAGSAETKTVRRSRRGSKKKPGETSSPKAEKITSEKDKKSEAQIEEPDSKKTPKEKEIKTGTTAKAKVKTGDKAKPKTKSPAKTNSTTKSPD
jgi:large subunit ribosomal protein L17